ncbi:MAG: peptidoglycan-binding domain-containing protein, partial [Hyphomicrobiaceae bacterium]
GRIIRRFRSNAIANTAVSATAFADLIGEFATAQIVDARPEIRALQKHLRRLGHYHAAIDGRFGPHTRHAIQAYRGDYRSLLAGLPTLDLLHELQGRHHVRALASGRFSGLRLP